MPKKKYDVERGFISKLLETKDMLTIKENQIKVSFFTGPHKQAYNYIQNSVMANGEVPTVRAFSQKFPTYDLEEYTQDTEYGGTIVGTEENLKFWCDEIRIRVKHNTIAELLEQAIEMTQDFNTEEAYALIKKQVSFIESEVTVSTSTDITKDTQSRVDAYKKKKENRGMLGYSTGLKHFDFLTKGLKNETLTTIIAGTGVGKAVTLDTPILTPTGFIPMRDVKLDDSVIDKDGLPCKVKAVYPQGKKQVHEVTFIDGSVVECCDEHLWLYRNNHSKNTEWRVNTLKEMTEKHNVLDSKGHANLSIPLNKEVQFLDNELPLDPYVLGVLLGDGGFTTDRISLTTVDMDILDTCNETLKEWGEFTSSTDLNYQYLFKGVDSICNNLYRTISTLNLKGHSSLDKFIPSEYLHTSIQNRRDLLRGLFDTDGHITPKGSFQFFTSSNQLKDDFIYLCHSLGYRTSLLEDDREENINYRITILTHDKIYGSDKHTRIFGCIPKSKNKNARKYEDLKVVGIKATDRYEEMQCIAVDSPSHTFICGDFIVTHNTWLEILIGCYCMLNGIRVLQLVTEMSEDLMKDRYEAMLFSMCYGSLNYNKFKSGSLDPKTEKQFFKFLIEDLPEFEPLVIATATSPMGVSAEIEKVKPDIVFIDGVYLMEDDQGAKDDWLRVAHITRDLKKLAKRAHKPIIINTQADKNTSKKTGPELGSIMFTQAIGQDSDDVISMYRDEIMINDNEMCIKILKQREGMLGKVMLTWDFTTMTFEEIYGESNETDNNVDTSDTEFSQDTTKKRDVEKNLINIDDED